MLLYCHTADSVAMNDCKLLMWNSFPIHPLWFGELLCLHLAFFTIRCNVVIYFKDAGSSFCLFCYCLIIVLS